ncbi:MAG: alpha-2-macroglobulin family protein [Bdellovibrionota bacterium]
MCKRRWSYRDADICFDSSNAKNKIEVASCLFKKSSREISCEVLPLEDLPYDKTVSIWLKDGLKTFEGDLKQTRKLVKEFKISDNYNYKQYVDKSELTFLEANMPSYLIKFEDWFYKNIKRFKFYYVVEKNKKGVAFKIPAKIRKIEYNKNKKYKIFKEIYYSNYGREQHTYYPKGKDSYLYNKDIFEIVPLRPLPFNANYKLVIDDIKAVNRERLKAKTLDKHKTYKESLKLNKIIYKLNDVKNVSLYKNYNAARKLRKKILLKPENYIKLNFNAPIKIYTVNYIENGKIKKSFSDYLPMNPESDYRILNIYAKDIFNRVYKKKLNIRYGVEAYAPAHGQPNDDISVLEKDIDSHLPLYAINLDTISLDYEKVSNNERRIGSKEFSLDRRRNVWFKVPLKIKEIFKTGSGIAKWKLSDNKNEYNDNLIIVTPFHVHFKIGTFNSLTWVTNLSDGKPVKDAKVEIILDDSQKRCGDECYEKYYIGLLNSYKILATGKTDSEGIAILDGMRKFSEHIDSEEPERLYTNDVYQNKQNLLVKVTKGDDVAFLPVNYDFLNKHSKEDWWDYRNARTSKKDFSKVWGTTSQGVYKRESTVQGKIVVREIDNESIKLPDVKKYNMCVYNPMNNLIHEKQNIALSEFGTYDFEFKLSKRVYTGYYNIYLQDKDFQCQRDFPTYRGEPRNSSFVLKFLVSDFTPPSFTVKSFLDKQDYVLGDVAILNVASNLYSGGPLSNGKLSVLAKVFPKTIIAKNKEYLDFDFRESNIACGERYEGKERLCSSHYVYSYNKVLYRNSNLTLKNDGTKKQEISIKDLNIPYGIINVESSVIDERGVSRASNSMAKYSDRNQFLGIRHNDYFLYTKEVYSPEFLVIDNNGEVSKNDAKIKIKIYYEDIKIVKEKNASGVFKDFKYENWHIIKKDSIDFKGKKLKYDLKFNRAGNYILYAYIKDGNGEVYGVTKSYFVKDEKYGTSSQEFSEETDYFRPEREEYKVGETAKFLLRSDYKNSLALITKERYGIKSHYTKFLEQENNIIEVPIDENDIPGVHVSVVLMKLREGVEFDKKCIEEYTKLYGHLKYKNKFYNELSDKCDAQKPSYVRYRSQVKVLGDDKELKIKVSTSKPEYKPSENIDINISVKNKSGKGVASELAIIVLDQSVYDLIQGSIDYFNPYKAFRGTLGSLNIFNFNILEKLVGFIPFDQGDKELARLEKIKREKKGENPGGDGVSSELRSNFKYLAYWEPSAITDENGDANISFKLPDNLTTFRVIAFAVDKKDKMGVGLNTFKVNKHTEIRPVMPNQVRVGDKFDARFTVLNKRGVKKRYKINYSVKQGKNGVKKEYSKLVWINPLERFELSFPVDVKKRKNYYYEVFASDLNDKDNFDGVVSKVKVLPVRNRETLGVYNEIKATKKGNKKTLQVKLPDGILKGQLKLNVSAIAINALEGVFEYMKDYSYTCWEQKLSRALVSAYYEVFRDFVPKSFVWKDGGRVFTNKMLQLAKNYQASRGGMTFFVPENGNISEYLSSFTMFGFSILKDLGYEIPSDVSSKLKEYILKMLNKDSELTSRVMAVYALSKEGALDKSEIIRVFNDRERMSLFAKSILLETISHRIKSGEKDFKKEAEVLFKDIINYGDETSSKLNFVSTSDESWQELYSSGRTNCSILSSFASYSGVVDRKGKEAEYLKEQSSKLFKTILENRRQDGSFGNTQENIFCLKAISDYIKKPEMRGVDLNFKGTLFNKEFANFNPKKNIKAESVVKLSKADSNKQGELVVNAKGKGDVYYNTSISYYSKYPLEYKNAGIAIQREYSVKRGNRFKLLRDGEKLEVGDIVRVDLYLSTPSQRSFVVVTDPLPGALEPINTDLAGNDRLDDEDVDDYYEDDSYRNTRLRWNTYYFYYNELLHDNARFYSEYLPKGYHHLRYKAVVVARGTFQAGGTFAEEMYNPDIFGRGKEASFVVGKK